MKRALFLLLCYLCFFSAADEFSDDISSDAATMRAMKVEIAQMRTEMQQKDAALMALTTALKTKTDYKQIQLTAGGEALRESPSYECLESCMKASCLWQ